jgi:hypothetical protein
VSQDVQAEIEAAVTQALADLGVRGSVAVVGTAIELHAGGAPTEIDIEQVLRQWPLLPPEMRRRRAEEVAGRLADATRATKVEGRPRSAEPSAIPNARVLGAIVGVFGLLTTVGVLRYVIPRLQDEKTEPHVPSESAVDRTARLSRACDAMRSRLLTGGSFGPFATEGWVVEIWLAGKKGGILRDHGALVPIIAGEKLTVAADEELARVSDGSAEIVDGFTGEDASRSPGYSAASILLRDGYARAFLDPELRPHFITLGERLADGTGADLAAIYARCAHLTTHDIGAWFRGPDAAGATASMVYTMGFFADALAVDRGAVHAVRVTGGELDQLRKAAADADGEALSRVVTGQGGTVSSARGVTFVFPLGGPTRAISATRAAARKMGVGVGAE